MYGLISLILNSEVNWTVITAGYCFFHTHNDGEEHPYGCFGFYTLNTNMCTVWKVSSKRVCAMKNFNALSFPLDESLHRYECCFICLDCLVQADFPFVLLSGRSSPCPCVDPHGWEAISVWDLWNALPSPADAEEPPAHSHRREALPCRLNNTNVFWISVHKQCKECLQLMSRRFLLFSVRNATCTSATRVSYDCIFGRSTAPSLTRRSNIGCQQLTCPLTWRRHAEL